MIEVVHPISGVLCSCAVPEGTMIKDRKHNVPSLIPDSSFASLEVPLPLSPVPVGDESLTDHDPAPLLHPHAPLASVPLPPHVVHLAPAMRKHVFR